MVAVNPRPAKDAGMNWSGRYIAAALALILGTLGGCAPRQDLRGAVLDEERLQSVSPGRTQAQIAQLLGTPTAVSTFSERNNTWYYISKETETLAFFREKTVDQKVVAIDFDPQGRVSEVRRFGLEDGRPIEPVAGATPSKGRELGFLEQLFGNLGRFNTDAGRNRDRVLPTPGDRR